MRSIMLMIIGLFLFYPFAKAQQNPASILKRAVEVGEKPRFISYTATTVNKNIFSNNDTAVTRINETLSRNAQQKIVAQNTTNADRFGHPVFREVFIHDTLYTLDFKDSVYSFQVHPKTVTGTLADYLEQLKSVLSKNHVVHQRPDTIIEHKLCYSLFVKSYDTVENNNHDFTHLYFYLDKKTLLPVYTKELGAGSASKGGYSLGRVNVFNERRFANFKIGQDPNAAIFKFDKVGFDVENKHMLENGSVAPLIQVSNLTGKKLSPEEFKNKILLIEFGSTTCGANPLAIPMLNRLAEKHKASEVTILSIYSDETIKQIRDYVDANSIKFPIYKGSIKLKKGFKTVGTPNFYLIDKNGIIVMAFDGYSNKMEQELILRIDKLKGN
ncbi:TlpA family protein disulfide reductase [Mucilaginibacter sp. Bleaf8]|uniref:TlpA family protein disulfide reductase n=1 Tax=Mucilaginibacter sp. Bleaf8 TaxID=2834430 RepID=UPI001BCDB5D0|nr:TlpA disulfide reductase family protein [Mucilaginibacter sp. Bleaf8]MBS7566835.1 TlpA family protein disulfide reductase [Mucilaginibacter sp. Bleaf8]